MTTPKHDSDDPEALADVSGVSLPDQPTPGGFAPMPASEREPEHLDRAFLESYTLPTDTVYIRAWDRKVTIQQLSVEDRGKIVAVSEGKDNFYAHAATVCVATVKPALTVKDIPLIRRQRASAVAEAFLVIMEFSGIAEVGKKLVEIAASVAPETKLEDLETEAASEAFTTPPDGG